MKTINELVNEKTNLEKESAMLQKFQDSIEFIPNHTNLINEIAAMIMTRSERIVTINRIFEEKI